MVKGAPVILVEFNELTPRLMERFIRDGKLPNFARLRAESHVYTTDAAAEGEDLNPWVQWVTVHTGLGHREHGVQHLADVDKLSREQIWDLSSAAGKTVWVCGSMNASYRTPLRGFVLPDPWSQNVAPHPRQELEPFYRFVLKNVQQYTQDKTAGSRLDLVKFGAFLATHGLTPETIKATLAQLVAERRDPTVRWKRAVILDRMAFDVFHHYWRMHKPELATFFLNSTAHFQHQYWRNLEPEAFDIKPTDDEQRAYAGAIEFGYTQMDHLVGRLLELAGNEAQLVFATALSQQPYLRAEKIGGKRHYRIDDGKLLAAKLGLGGRYRYEPVMADEFYLRFEDEAAARAAEALLPSFRAGGEPPLRVIKREGRDVFAQCKIRKALPEGTMIESADGRPLCRYYDVFHLVEGLKSGYHHPDGMLWIRHLDRRHREHAGKVPLTAVAPTVLDLLGVAPPTWMPERSLLTRGANARVANAR
jgi:hypothetical protein